MKRGPYRKVAERNAPLVELLRRLKYVHPRWGYRKVCRSLCSTFDPPVNHKRVLRLMREHGLLSTDRLSKSEQRRLYASMLRDLVPAAPD